jgi:hypothetical protein
MQPFFSFWGAVIIALWSAVEVSQAVNGWFLPLCAGVGIFGLVLIAVFRDIDMKNGMRRKARDHRFRSR